MPIVPESEIQVKFLAVYFKETDEKRGEILVNIFVDFRPSISREIGRKKFRTNSSTHQDLKPHTAEPKFFHNDTLGVGGPKVSNARGAPMARRKALVVNKKRPLTTVNFKQEASNAACFG